MKNFTVNNNQSSCWS